MAVQQLSLGLEPFKCVFALLNQPNSSQHISSEDRLYIPYLMLHKQLKVSPRIPERSTLHSLKWAEFIIWKLPGKCVQMSHSSKGKWLQHSSKRMGLKRVSSLVAFETFLPLSKMQTWNKSFDTPYMYSRRRKQMQRNAITYLQC